jgi:hypothetical protein
MSYGVKHDKQIVVFNDQLLRLGALMSITSNEADVADQVVRLLHQSSPRKAASRPRMAPLTTLHIELNAEVAHELGLTAAPEFEQQLAIQ